MQLNFGGPVWHASGNTRLYYPSHLSGTFSRMEQDTQSKDIAYDALEGVGDASLGEWVEVGKRGPLGASIWHVRRRLSRAEQEATGLDVVDMRNTEQGRARVHSFLLQYPLLKPLAVRIGEWT